MAFFRFTALLIFLARFLRRVADLAVAALERLGQCSCFGLSRMLGARVALMLGVGFAAFVVIVFTIIVAMCVVGSYAHELVSRIRRASEH